jgi:hypothetical protein
MTGLGPIGNPFKLATGSHHSRVSLMNSIYPVLAAALLACTLATPSFAGSASGQAMLGCCVVLGPTPTITQLGDYTEVQVAVSNPLAASAVGLVYAIVHDGNGQIIASSSGVLNVGPSSNGTATILIFGLRLGALYSLTIFAVDGNGEAISATETVNLAPEQGFPVNAGAPLGTDTFGLGFCGAQVVDIDIPCEGYINASNSTIYGVAYLVLHNSLGQTVGISAALIVLSPGEDSAVLMPIIGPNGSASEFAVSVDDLAISPLATVSLLS